MGGPHPNRDLTIGVVRGGRAAVVTVAGEIDIATAPRLRTALLAECGDHDELVVDLAGVSHLDCAGVGALLAARAAVGRLRLVGAHGIVLRVLEILGVDKGLG
ncbi:STAS domain-containing protein [Allokutzneria albata]|uniref:Anti-sigma factor antagonist n=1 Tax=Allokutzneria albata TaxID=211114 RepID=A0A1G9R245_ALLAB|nr:STAS domain-containing protein [Allokutzneria albata]SDM17293.1 anti-anti-sigma factor [Allokutzneria albata]